MAYKILRVNGNVDFDVIPAAVIKNFPLEKRDYKPYTQAKAVLSLEGISVMLMAFEALPEEKSSVKIVFKFGEALFSAEVFADKSSEFYVNNENVSNLFKTPHFFKGEDLQGKYWAADFTIPMDFIQKYNKDFSVQTDKIEGNIYKLCLGNRPHKGSYFPVDFEKENPFSQLGIFETENY